MRDDGVCVLTFDRAGSSANIFDRATLDELREQLDFIEKEPRIKGVVLVSAKRSIFIAGLDLKSVTDKATPEDVREIIETGQSQFNRIAALK
ncbi:MAG TPA: enoyl-CoA hydratase-related protein, partial [Desulfuromonadaceae bacterium]|nr:enoyl-CoA hydratase-related protein [Desulfuromonadaceae bacterium]